MSGFTKLYSSILASTIWSEPNHVRILWITMLAMADRDGTVNASIPGLAQLARLSVENVEDGIGRLMSPDRYSRTSDHEGRRIATVDGGWHILNYRKYRKIMSKEEMADYKRVKQQQYRDEKRAARVENVENVEASRKSGHIAEAEAEAEAEAQRPPIPPQGADGDFHLEIDPKEVKRRKANELAEQMEAIYQAYPHKVSKPDGLRAIKKALKKCPFEVLLERTKHYASVVKGWPADTGANPPNPATWFNGERFNDDPSTWERKPSGRMSLEEAKRQATEPPATPKPEPIWGSYKGL